MLLRQIFDSQLAQYAYLIGCQRSGEALIIDPERDIDRYQEIAQQNGLRITSVCETHIHADFLSGAREFSQDPSIQLFLSAEGGEDWQYAWPRARPNTQFLHDGDKFYVGKIQIQAVHTPGHTPEHLSFLITDLGAGADEPIALATGDFLFMGDVGRPDLLESAAGIKHVMEPSARSLGQSLRDRLVPYADYLQVLPGHGAGSACGKSLGAVPITTIGYERKFNKALRLAVQDVESFVKDILQGQPDPPLYFATMKTLNRDGARVTGGVPKVPQLDSETFRDLLSKQSVRVLDTRDSLADFHQGHVERSISAPLRSAFFSNSAGSFLGPDEPFILILERAEDLDLATRQLYRIGIDGAQAWILFSDVQSSGLCNRRTEIQQMESFSPALVGTEGAILDVRTTAEFNAKHLPGALSIPYTRLRARVSEIPAEKKLYIHCASGKRAALASSFLAAEGHEVVYLDGEFAACVRNNSI